MNEEKINIKQRGCDHYIRGCKLISPCCGKIYTCRHCHNEIEDIFGLEKPHQIDRFNIKEIICIDCEEKQPVSNKCIKCENIFGKYFCEKCNFFDDRIERNYYHCNGCGICRIAYDKEYIHCDNCGICLIKDDFLNHICRKDTDKEDCPVCLEKLFTSIKKVCTLKCSHHIHQECLLEYVRSNNTTCPKCRKSIFNKEVMDSRNEILDREIEQNPLPEEIQKDTNIICNDCSSKSTVKWHPFGMKCSSCLSYNTSKM